MTPLSPPANTNAQAVHFDFEPFAQFAAPELALQSLHMPGVCFNPLCSCKFNPTRDWQQYCSPACRRAGEQEMRRIGQKAAPALLAWQMGRYSKGGALADLSRAGRRYYSSLAADWLRDRKAGVRDD